MRDMLQHLWVAADSILRIALAKAFELVSAVLSVEAEMTLNTPHCPEP